MRRRLLSLFAALSAAACAEGAAVERIFRPPSFTRGNAGTPGTYVNGFKGMRRPWGGIFSPLTGSVRF